MDILSLVQLIGIKKSICNRFGNDSNESCLLVCGGNFWSVPTGTGPAPMAL